MRQAKKKEDEEKNLIRESSNFLVFYYRIQKANKSFQIHQYFLCCFVSS